MGEVLKMRGASITPCTLTVEQAAAKAECSKSQIYHNMHNFIHRRIGKYTKINEASLCAWINSRTKESDAELMDKADRILAGVRSC